jgi:peroxiredoxin
MKKLVIALFLTGLLTGAVVAAEPAPKVGCPAPALELTTLNGQTIKLQDYQGKKNVVLTFFASWSKSCQEELKAWQELYGDNRSALEVLAVSFDKKSKDLKAFLAKTDPPFPVLYDKKLATIDNFQILIIPTTFCINRDGVIEKIFVDYDDNVQKAVAAWLKS